MVAPSGPVGASIFAFCFLLFAFPAPPPLLAQSPPPHDIGNVDTAPIGGAISVPLPEAQRKQLKKYDIPELVGARQALGSQLIDGKLPRPIIDFTSVNAKVHERISLFEGGLVVVDV